MHTPIDLPRSFEPLEDGVMKVARLLFVFLLVSTPVLMVGSAYADGCSGSTCKSEDTPPVDKSAAPVPLLSAPPVQTAAPCGSSNCKNDMDNPETDSGRRLPPAPPTGLFFIIGAPPILPAR